MHASQIRARRWAHALALFLLIATVIAPSAHAETHTRRLYPGVAPGSQTWKFAQSIQKTARGEIITNVRDPEIVAYLPDASKANGAAVIVLPGGALRMLVLGQENQDIIERFTARGIAVIVLKYRTVQADPAAPPGGPLRLPKLEIRNANANPDPQNAALNDVLHLATADAQTALRLVRAHAKDWRIDPSRVGMIGSSAGGGVAISTLLAGAPGAAPDFIISLYGPSLQDVAAPANAPPLFIATEANHGPVTDGLLALFSLWKQAGRPAELHVYEVPIFTMPVSLWADRAFAWMEEQTLLAPAAKSN